MSYNQRLEDLLDHHLIDNEDLIKRKKLGGVGYVINGNMCLGIYENFLVARVGNSLAQTLVKQRGISYYEEGNENLADFILVSETIYNHPKALQKFIDRSISYTCELPPNEPDDSPRLLN